MSAPTDRTAGNHVRLVKDLRIPVGDGISLGADLYLPPEDGPFPTLMSFYPYHKDDLIGALFDGPRRALASRGYADLLVDIRGTGRSEGIYPDMFDGEREARDGAEAVEWAAAQEWCDGNVGLWGMSYGAITALAIAARQPAHLRACVPLFGSADRYKDSIYPGGILNAIGRMTREAFMLAMDLGPITYQDPEGDWLRLWQEHIQRVKDGKIWSLSWQSHRLYDSQWQSRATDCAQIGVPTFFIGGWGDIFADGIVRAYTSVQARKRIVIGPWLHELPDAVTVEPWDWLSEVASWFDCWLRAQRDLEPANATVFLQGPSGKWVELDDLPAPDTHATSWYLSSDHSLTAHSSHGGYEQYEGDPRVGSRGALLDPMGTGLGYPLDQGTDNRLSLCFTTEPLESSLTLLGWSEARLFVTLVRGQDLDLVAKLCAVTGIDDSRLLATGRLNGRHRDGHDRDEPIRAGEIIEYRFPLWATGQRVEAGTRLRLALSCADWPCAFPTTTNPTILVHFGPSTPSTITLPVVSESSLRSCSIVRPSNAEERNAHVIDRRAMWEIVEEPAEEAVAVSYGVTQEFLLPHGPRFHLEFHGSARVARQRPDGAAVKASAQIATRLSTGEMVRVASSVQARRHTLLLSGSVRVDDHVLLDDQWKNY